MSFENQLSTKKYDLTNCENTQKNDFIVSSLIFDSFESINSEFVFVTKYLLKSDQTFAKETLVDQDCSTISNLFDIAFSEVLSILKEDQISVLNYRFINSLSLAEIGELMNKTRERVRQIEEATIKKLFTFLPTNLLKHIKDNLSQHQVLPIETIPLDSSYNKTILISMLCHKKLRFNYYFNHELNLLVANPQYLYKAIVDKLIQKSLNNGNTLLSKEVLIKLIKEISPQIKPQNLIDKLIQLNDMSTVEDKYFFHSQYKRKRDMVEFIYKLSPSGYENQDIQIVVEALNKYFPGEFTEDSPRNILSLAQINDNVILWDWGKYIHADYIKHIVEEYDFTDVLDYISTTLETAEQIELNHYFDKNKEMLNDFGIISKYGLHSLLKFKYPDAFSYQDSPWIASEGSERKIIGDIVLSAMKEARAYSLLELSQKLQTRTARIQQLIDRNADIIIVDTFTYMKKSDIQFPHELLKKIVAHINNIIHDIKFIYISLIIDEFRVELNCINNYNRETLILDLLKKTSLSKEFNISNTRIISKDYPITRTSLNFHYLVEKNLLCNIDFIEKSKLFDYFLKRGLSQSNIMLYYFYSNYKSIIRENSEKFIKLSSLRLDNIILKNINLLFLESIIGEENIDDILFQVTNKLPDIGLKWNRYLLSDLLDSNLFDFYPNKVEPRYIKLKHDTTQEDKDIISL